MEASTKHRYPKVDLATLGEPSHKLTANKQNSQKKTIVSMFSNGQVLLSLLFCTNGFLWIALEAYRLAQRKLSFQRNDNKNKNSSNKENSYTLLRNNEPIMGSIDADCDDEQELICTEDINRETTSELSKTEESLNQRQDDKSKTKQTFVEQLLFITRRLTVLGALLLVVWFAENKPIFDHAIKEYHRSNFVILIVLFFVLGLVTIVKIKDGEEAERKEELECNLLLNRDQTEEWKGWMQYIFIIYHYTKAEEAYDFVRVLVSCYVWMTGFGNFSFFYIKKDYSIARVWRLMWRLNFSALFLCLTVNNSPMLYYIVPLHTVYFLVVYATMVAQHKYNRTKWFPRLKIFLLALIIFVIWDVPGVMKNILTLFGLIPLSRDAHEFYFRTYLDHYSALFGMIFALNFPMMVNWFQKTQQQPENVYKRAILGSIFALFLAWAWYIMHLPKDKLVYNSLHPYFTCIPIIAYILIRNYSAILRNRYSAAFRHFGKMTLETYLLQHHLLLAENAKKLLVLIPGHPVLNMLVVSVLFIFCSKLLFNLTMDLRDAFASEEHTDQQIWIRFKVIVFAFSFLYLVAKMLSLIEVTMSAPLLGSLVLTCSIVFAMVLLFIFLRGKRHEHWIASSDRIFNISLISLVIVSSAFITHSLFRYLFQLDEKGSKKLGYVGGSMLWGVFSVCFSLGSILLFDNYSGLLSMSLCLWSRGVKQVKYREAYSRFIIKDSTQDIKDSNRVLKMIKLVVGVSCTLASVVIFGYALHRMQLQSIVSVEKLSEPAMVPLTEETIIAKCSSLSPQALSLYHSNIDWTSGVKAGSNVTLYIKGGATFLGKLKPSETVTMLYGRARSDISDIGFLFTPCGTDCFCAGFQVFEAGQYTLDVGVAQQSSIAKFTRYINVNQSSMVITGKQFAVVQCDSEIMRTMHMKPLFPNILHAPINETYVLDGRYVNQKYALDSYAQAQLPDSNSAMEQTTFRNWSNGFVDRKQVFIHNRYLLKLYSLSEARQCLAKHWNHMLWFGDSNSRRLMTLLLHGEKNPCKDRSASCWIVGGRYRDIFGFHVERKVWIGLNEQTSDPETVLKSFYSRKEEGALIRFMFINGLNSVENGSHAFTTLDRWKQFKDPSAQGVKLIVLSAGNWDGQRSSMPEWEKNIDKLASILKERFIDKGIQVVWFTPNFHTQTLFLNPYAVHQLTSIGAKVLDGFSLGIWRPDELPFPGYTGHSAWNRMEIQMQLLYNMLCNNME